MLAEPLIEQRSLGDVLRVYIASDDRLGAAHQASRPTVATVALARKLAGDPVRE
jgi:hypothetical protein